MLVVWVMSWETEGATVGALQVPLSCLVWGRCDGGHLAPVAAPQGSGGRLRSVEGEEVDVTQKKRGGKASHIPLLPVLRCPHCWPGHLGCPFCGSVIVLFCFSNL